MSDGLSDTARDVERSEKAETYYNCLYAYLKSRSNTDRAKLFEAAGCVDAVNRGLLTSKTKHSHSLDRRIEALRAGDRREWALVLRACMEDVTLFRKLKTLSPFANETVLFVNYGHGFVTIEGELKELLAEFIHENDLMTYDCDKYLVTIPKLERDSTHIEWMSCGIYNQKEPRTSRGRNRGKV